MYFDQISSTQTPPDLHNLTMHLTSCSFFLSLSQIKKRIKTIKKNPKRQRRERSGEQNHNKDIESIVSIVLAYYS